MAHIPQSQPAEGIASIGQPGHLITSLTFGCNRSVKRIQEQHKGSPRPQNTSSQWPDVVDRNTSRSASPASSALFDPPPSTTSYSCSILSAPQHASVGRNECCRSDRSLSDDGDDHHQRHSSVAPNSDKDCQADQIRPLTRNSPTAGTGEKVVDVAKGREFNNDSDTDFDVEDSDSDEHDSGGFDWLEHVVMSAAENDMDLAVDLLNSIERGWKSACQARSERVHGWRQTAGGDPDQAATTTEGRPQSPSSQSGRPRKRAKRPEKNSRRPLGNDGDDEEEDEGEESDREKGDEPGSRPALDEEHRLVCPFFKRFPERFGPTGTVRRACFGSGYKTIKDLREHLKRTHFQIRCPRCLRLFKVENKDEGAAFRLRDEHLQQETPCIQGDPSQQDGITDAQWSALTKKGTGVKAGHRLAKYTEIWNILFPGIPTPRNPYHDKSPTRPSPIRAQSSKAESFVNLLRTFISRREESGDFQTGGHTANESFVMMAQKAYELAESINGESAASSSVKTRLTYNSTVETSLPDALTPQSRSIAYPRVNTTSFRSPARPAGQAMVPSLDMGAHTSQQMGPAYLPPSCTGWPNSTLMAPPQWAPVQFPTSFMDTVDGFQMVNMPMPYYFTGPDQPEHAGPNNGE